MHVTEEGKVCLRSVGMNGAFRGTAEFESQEGVGGNISIRFYEEWRSISFRFIDLLMTIRAGLRNNSLKSLKSWNLWNSTWIRLWLCEVLQLKCKEKDLANVFHLSLTCTLYMGCTLCECPSQMRKMSDRSEEPHSMEFLKYFFNWRMMAQWRVGIHGLEGRRIS